jgi:serine/threonine protein kinase/tetratricopeptide (TPR) repeat protein
MPRCPACYRRLAARAICPRDGQIPPSITQASVEGTKHDFPLIPGYVLREPLGEGGFARVWTATRNEDGVTVAIKVGHSEGHTVAARFIRESEILKSVGPPFAPQWYDSGVVDGKPFIVMELIYGETLAQQLARQSNLPSTSWVTSTAEGIVTALETLHGRSLVHRDLKPENVVITNESSRTVLLDFGLAKDVAPRKTDFPDTRITRAGMAIGTPEYMAPEAVRGLDDVDARADVYAFGVLLFELFTLRVPFVGSGAMIEHGHVSLRPPRPSDFAPVPPLWERLILACLAKDPSRRPSNAHSVRRAIREITTIELSSTSHAVSSSVSEQIIVAPKLLSEGRHPTILLFAEVAGPAALICNRIKAARGHVVRQRGVQYTAIFSGFDTDDPASAALAAAREIVQKKGRVALHLAQVTIRRKDRGAPLVYGAAVERPETWLPTVQWSGLTFTSELQAILPLESIADPASVRPKSLRSIPQLTDVGSQSAFEMGSVEMPGQSTDRALPLIGREETTAAIEAGVRLAFSQRVPRLVTLIGDSGLGKTRIAEHAIEYCSTHFSDACIAFAMAAPPGTTDGMRESASILRQIVEAPVNAPADIGEFFTNALGEEMGNAAIEALCALFGWAEASAGDQSVHRMRAIAQAIRLRARRQPVAVIIDDGHRADDALLDALEYVTLDGENLPVWVFVTASPSFDEQRRVWGRRTRHFDRVALGPLADESAKELAARLLHPAEYPPADVLERLATWGGGNPFCLNEIVRALKRLGIVKKRERGASYYVATADVEVLPAIPAWQWLAVRQLDIMPPELAACVRLCAVLGMSFGREELDYVQIALDRAGDAGSPLDTDVALGALVSRRILQRGAGDRYTFQNGVLEGAIYEMLDPAQRQKVHRHAFELWKQNLESSEQSKSDALERLGRHAAALGERAHAATAFLQLGGLARQRHKETEADRYYSATIAYAPEDDKLCRARAFLGRGQSRYRVSRVKDASDDFRRAGQLADELGYRRMQAEVLLEEATALDWSRDFAASAEKVRLAEPIVEELDAADLRVRLLVAQGRSAFRGSRTSESIELFERARIASKEANDYDSLVITLLLFAFELTIAGRLDDAERLFQEVITMTEEANDRPHLSVALANRVALWYGRRALDRAMQDLQRAIDLAREIGNPWLERLAAHNMATLLHWSDAREGAVEFGRRAQLLTERFFEPAFITSSLLYARILIAAEAFEHASRLYDWIKQSYAPETSSSTRARGNYYLVGLVLREFAPTLGEHSANLGTWDTVMAIAATDQEEQIILEVLYWRLRTALHSGDLDDARRSLEDAQQRLAECPLWVRDFAAMAKTLESA